MFVTIGICTFNRAESLRRTLDSLLAMRVPNDLAWEIVIVNNNCTDHTDDVISKYVGPLPVRREFEPRAGKSNALNRAIDVAKGDYIWIDDDVLVDPGLLSAYAAAFRRWPEATVFGGRIKPKYKPLRRRNGCWKAKRSWEGHTQSAISAITSCRFLPTTKTIFLTERIGHSRGRATGLSL